MSEVKPDQHVVMVGASFEEIEAAAAAAVRTQLDLQMEKITPAITKSLEEYAATMKRANSLIKRLTLALSITVFLLGLESAVLVVLLFHR